MSELRHDKTSLAARLRSLAERDTRTPPAGEAPPFISAFVSREREVIARFSSPVSGLVVVIQGCKEVCWGAGHRQYGSGDAFVLPAGSIVDVVNTPDEAAGAYRALFLRFSRDLVIEAARRWPDLVGQPPRETSVGLGSSLCGAISHVGEALAGASRRVVEHRILEVILILAEQGALRLTPKYVEGSMVEAVRLLVRHRLDRDWTAAAVAAAFATSEATLRRRLRGEGASLRDLLLAERMRAAHVLLHDRDAEVADAIAATGYASRSHFARHFRQAYGISPSSARRRRSAARAGSAPAQS